MAVIVNSWATFLENISGSTDIKWANPHEVDGTIVLTGNGSRTSPYVVSTVDEMLFATQASSIYKVKLINKELGLYRYTENDTEVYCLYDRTPTTIDFNDINPNGYSDTTSIMPSVDFNGWTLKNLRFLNYGRFAFNNTLSNVNMLNIIDENGLTEAGVIGCNGVAENIKLSCMYSCSQGYAIFGVRSGSNSAFRGLINSSFDVITTQRVVKVLADSGYHYTPKADSLKINVKLSTESTNPPAILCGIILYNSKITGEITAPNCPDSYYNTGAILSNASTNNIIDIKANVETGNNQPYLRPIAYNSFNIVTNDRGVKYYLYGSNVKSVPYSTLFDSEALYNLGLPIQPN